MNEEYAEEEGIQAIIYMQSLVGIVETEEEAKIGWNNMSHAEQSITVLLYRKMKDI